MHLQLRLGGPVEHGVNGLVVVLYGEFFVVQEICFDQAGVPRRDEFEGALFCFRFIFLEGAKLHSFLGLNQGVFALEFFRALQHQQIIDALIKVVDRFQHLSILPDYYLPVFRSRYQPLSFRAKTQAGHLLLVSDQHPGAGFVRLHTQLCRLARAAATLLLHHPQALLLFVYQVLINTLV